MTNTIQSLPKNLHIEARLHSAKCSLACAVSALARSAAADTDEDVGNVQVLLASILHSLDVLESDVLELPGTAVAELENDGATRQ